MMRRSGLGLVSVTLPSALNLVICRPVSGLAGHPLRSDADCPVKTAVLAVDLLRRGGAPMGLLPGIGNLVPPFRGSPDCHATGTGIPQGRE